ncbi:hypothetical protein OXX59_008171 [Metschnikowia pulcherrima]
MRAFHHKALIIIPAFYGLLLGSDRATLIAFSANERLGEVFAQTSVLGVAMLVGACPLGAAASSLFAGQLCDKFGFLHITRLAGILWVSGCLGTFFSPENVYIVLCKLVKGFGVGIASVAVPLYVFEVLVPPHRASAIGWATAFSIMGQAAIYGLGVLLRFTLGNPADAFHYTWLAEIAWGVLVVITSVFLPESPKFLARRGEWVQATTSLERLSRQQDMSLTSVSPVASRFSDLFSKQIRAKFLFAVAVQLFARASCVLGVTHVIHYTLAFCRLEDSLVESIHGTIFALQFLFTALSIFIMKSARRKDMLAYGFFLLTVSFCCLGATSYVYATRATHFFAYAPIVQVSLVPASSVLALTAFAFSVASLLITSSALSFTLEILPCDSRSRGVSVAMSTAWTVETLAASSSVELAQIDPFVVFFFLAVISVLGMLVTVFVYEGQDPAEGLPFPMDIVENGEQGEKSEAPNSDTGLENETSAKSSASGSIRKKTFQPQNFVPIHKRSSDANTDLPHFVVTNPAQLTTKSGYTELQMQTAETNLPQKPAPARTMEDTERLFTATEGNRLAAYKTLDSKVTISGLWSEVSDYDGVVED